MEKLIWQIRESVSYTHLYILNTPSGQLKNGMVERIEQLEVPLAHVIPEMTSNLLVPIAIIVYLFVLDWRMALVSLITIPRCV